MEFIPVVRREVSYWQPKQKKNNEMEKIGLHQCMEGLYNAAPLFHRWGN